MMDSSSASALELRAAYALLLSTSSAGLLTGAQPVVAAGVAGR